MWIYVTDCYEQMQIHTYDMISKQRNIFYNTKRDFSQNFWRKWIFTFPELVLGNTKYFSEKQTNTIQTKRTHRFFPKHVPHDHKKKNSHVLTKRPAAHKRIKLSRMIFEQKTTRMNIQKFDNMPPNIVQKLQ